MIAYITAIDNNGFRGYSAYSFIHSSLPDFCRFLITLDTNGGDGNHTTRLSTLKTELKTVEKEISQLQLVPEIKVTIDELQNCWHDFLIALKQKTDLTLVKSVLERTTSVVVRPDELIITIDVASVLVPGTGIEPVRVSLPEGF